MRCLHAATDPGGGPVDVPRTRDQVLVPPIDLYETDDGWVAVADVPGVGKDDLDLDVDKGVLTIQARVAQDSPDGGIIHQEYEPADFHRSFPLSDQVDRGRITANVASGVLTIVLPKAEQAKPRKIIVEGGE